MKRFTNVSRKKQFFTRLWVLLFASATIMVSCGAPEETDVISNDSSCLNSYESLEESILPEESSIDSSTTETSVGDFSDASDDESLDASDDESYEDMNDESNDDESNDDGHDYKKTVIKPTCTSGGYTEYTCKICGESYIDKKTDPIDHESDSWTVTKTAKCSTAGERTGECKYCKKTVTQQIPALGHNYDNGKVIKQASTCADMGIKRFTCKTCSDSYDKKIKGEHVFGDIEWSFFGVPRYRCQGCGYTYTDFLKFNEEKESENPVFYSDKISLKESAYTGMLANWSDEWISYMEVVRSTIGEYVFSKNSGYSSSDDMSFLVSGAVSVSEAKAMLEEYNGAFRSEFSKCFGWTPVEGEYVDNGDGTANVGINWKKQYDAYKSQRSKISSSKKREVVKDLVAYYAHQAVFDGMAAYNAVGNITDCMNRRIVYDYTYGFSSAYDALAAGSSVCSGQTEVFIYLCDYMGIKSEEVIGRLQGSAHSWNRVIFSDGTVRYVDATNTMVANFLLVTEEELRRTHKW